MDNSDLSAPPHWYMHSPPYGYFPDSLEHRSDSHPSHLCHRTNNTHLEKGTSQVCPFCAERHSFEDNPIAQP